MRRLSEKSESYKTAATLFIFSGLVFIIVSIVSGKVGVFLPVGVALAIIGMVFRQEGRKSMKHEEEDSSE